MTHEPKQSAPSEPCKSEGVNNSVFAQADPPALQVDEQFTIYLDDEGDYIVKARRQHLHQHLVAHGATPDAAIWVMRETLGMVASMATTLPSVSAAQDSEKFARLISECDEYDPDEYMLVEAKFMKSTLSELSSLRSAAAKAYEAMSARNNPFDPEFWASAVDGLQAALAASPEAESKDGHTERDQK